MFSARNSSSAFFFALSRPVRRRYFFSGISPTLEKLKGTIIELMAKRMNEKDIQEFTNHWEKRIDEKDIIHKSQPENLVKSQKMPENSISEEQKEEKQVVLKPLEPKVKTEINLFHPLLGERVSDLGYKQVYLSNIRSLMKTPVWKRQRILRPERAALIANSKISKGLASTISGPISVYWNNNTQEIGIIDGQHRVGALMILAQKGHWNDLDRNVLVEVFPVNEEKDVAALFREINSAEPVRMIDMPTASDAGQQEEDGESSDQSDPQPATTEINTTQVVSGAVEMLAQEYSVMFKPSSRCKPPHLNIDVTRDELFQSGALSRSGAKTTEEFYNYLKHVNTKLGAKLEKDSKLDSDVPCTGKRTTQQAAWAKAQANKFFLGLDKGWMYK